MKKIFIILIIIISIFILTSCERTNDRIDPVINETEDIIVDEIINPTTEDEEINEITSSDTELSYIDLSFLIELDWPEADLRIDEIEFKVFPLTDYLKGIYSTSIVGDITFVDEQLNPIKLPFQPIAWIYIYNYDQVNHTQKPIGYALKESGDKWESDFILMFADGTVPLDSNGEYIKLLWTSYDGYSGIVSNGNSVIIQNKEGLGIYDLKNQREVLPCKYDSIAPVDSIYYIVNDKQGFLYDRNGKELYSLGELTDEQLQYTYEFVVYINDIYRFNCNTINYGSANAEYCLNVKGQTFFKIDNNAEINNLNTNMNKWNGYIIISSYENNCVYITDMDGKVLYVYNGRCFYYETANEYLVLYTVSKFSGFVIINKELNERKFPVNSSDFSWNSFNKFYDNMVFYKNSNGGLNSVDEAGNTVERGFDRVYQKDGYCYLQDENGNILLSHKMFGENDKYNGRLELRGDFVFLYVNPEGDDMSMYAKTVYSLDGKLLVENVYGIADSPAPNGGIFVYITPDICIVLYPDGNTVPVSAAPVVKRRVWNQY